MIPSTTPLFQKSAGRLALALVLLAAAAGPAPAAAPAGQLAATSVFADEEGWSFRRIMHKYANRNNVVQLCVVCMLIALAIIIKKLDGDDSPRPRLLSPVDSYSVTASKNNDTVRAAKLVPAGINPAARSFLPTAITESPR